MARYRTDLENSDLGEAPRADATQSIGLRPRKRRSWGLGRSLLLLIALIAAIVWFAPSIVMKTGLRNQLTSMALGDFPGQVIIGSGSSGWLSPLELRDVAIWDADGQPIASIPLISSEKHLLGLASDPTQLGGFQIHQPDIQVVLSENSSNLEQMLESFIAPADPNAPPSSASSVGLHLHVLDGRLLLQDSVTGESCAVEKMNVDLQLPKAAPDPISAHLSAETQYLAERGSISANFSWQMPAEITQLDLGDGQLQLISDRFPLAALRPFVRRVQPDLQLAGQFVSNAGFRWQRGEQGPQLQGQGEMSVHELQLTSPSVLGDDALRLAQVATTVDLTTEKNQFEVKSIQLNTDFADLQISGHADLAELLSDGDVWAKLVDWQSSYQVNVRGHVDLAKAATLLPETLRLREGMQISRGGFTLQCNSRMELGHRLVQGSLQSDRIEATHQGRTFSWDQPLHLALDGVASETGVEIRNLSCESDFLQIEARGTLSEGTLQATGDLQKLAAQLGEFCDLGDLELAGQLVAEGAWNQQPDRRCTGGLKAVIRQFAMATAGMTAIREQELHLQADATGQLGGASIDVLETAQLQITSGEDHLIAHLTRGVNQPSLETAWPVSCRMKGHTESWLARAQPWLALGDFDIHAGLNANASGEFGTEQVVIDACQIELTQLNLRGGGLLVREPKVSIDGQASWSADSNRLVLPSFTLMSSALAARGDQVAIDLHPERLSARGAIGFRGDLQRLVAWQYAAQPPTMQPKGQFQGQVKITTDGHTISFDGTTDIAAMSLEQRQVTAAGVGPWTVTWSEPNVRVHAIGSYDPTTDGLTLARAEVAASSLSLAAEGTITQTTTRPVAALEGAMNYDVAVLAEQLRTSLGPDVQIAGRRSAPFSVRGPLMADAAIPGGPGTTAAAAQVVSPELIAETTIGWDSLIAYGMAIGPQEITTRLERGVIQFSPLETSLAQGRLSVAPRIELNANPMMLAIDEGMVAEGIQITPEMCAGWFKYVAPILAEATTAEGRMSVALQGARIPLLDPMSASIAGTIAVESARMQSGPMAEQLLGTINEVAALIQRSAPELDFLKTGKSLLEITPQQIEFQMSQGRVFHRNLEFRSGNIAVRTQGWVGVDQSIGLLAEIPVRDEWVDRHAILAELRGQTIKLPVQGNFSRPQIDRRAIAQLSSQLIGNTAQRMLQDEVQKGLKKLLGPK